MGRQALEFAARYYHDGVAPVDRRELRLARPREAHHLREPGAHSQADSLDELSENLREVIAMLLEDGLPEPEAEFAGIQTITA